MRLPHTMHWNDSLPIHHRAGSIIFMLSVFASLSGCTTTLQRQRYQLAEDQRQMVRRFEGYETTSRDWSSWHCLKKVLKPDMEALIAYPLLVGISPLCMFSAEETPSRVDSRVGGALEITVIDDASNPMKDIEWIVGEQGERQRTSSSGKLRLLIPKDGLSMRCSDSRYAAGTGSPITQDAESKENTPLKVTYRWDQVDSQTWRVVGETGDARLEDVSRLILIDTEAPTDTVATMQDAGNAIVRKLLETMLLHGRKRVAVLSQAMTTEAPEWLSDAGTSIQRGLEGSAEIKQNVITVVSVPLIKRAVQGIAQENRLISEVGRLTGADTVLLISGRDVEQGRLAVARFLRSDGMSMRASARVLIRQAR